MSRMDAQVLARKILSETKLGAQKLRAQGRR